MDAETPHSESQMRPMFAGSRRDAQFIFRRPCCGGNADIMAMQVLYNNSSLQSGIRYQSLARITSIPSFTAWM